MKTCARQSKLDSVYLIVNISLYYIFIKWSFDYLYKDFFYSFTQRTRAVVIVIAW